MAQILSGKDVSAEIRAQLKEQVDALKARDKSFRPGLTIVQVGGREDSNVYIKMKIKAAEEIGIDAKHLRMPRYIKLDSIEIEFYLSSDLACQINDRNRIASDCRPAQQRCPSPWHYCPDAPRYGSSKCTMHTQTMSFFSTPSFCQEIDSKLITDRVLPSKDVDGLCTINQGRVAIGEIEGDGSFIPCTPAGCLELIKRSGVEIKGAQAVVVCT